MKLKYLLSFFKTAKVPGLLPIMMDWKGMLRLHFLYSAFESGLLEALKEPCSRSGLLEKLEVKSPDILDALLKVGVSIKELQYQNGYYNIKGKRSLALTGEQNDIIAAVVQANVTYYNNSYRYAAERMRGAPLGDDLESAGEIIARFSKLTDPVMKSFLSEIIDGQDNLRVLDIGCGSGLLLKTIAGLIPNASGVGIDIDKEVANQARQNIKNWDLESKFEIMEGDILSLLSNIEPVNLITLMNLVYYIPVESRVYFFSALGSRLLPEGGLAIVMNMQGKDSDSAAANLNMANASLKGVTPLPHSSELRDQLLESGFKEVKVRKLMPGSSFVGIHALNFSKSDANHI